MAAQRFAWTALPPPGRPSTPAQNPAAWRGSLFLAAPGEECLYRVAGLNQPATAPVVEGLFCGQLGPIVAVASADDGLYFATASRAEGGAGDPGTASGGKKERTAGAIYRVRDAATPAKAAGRR